MIRNWQNIFFTLTFWWFPQPEQQQTELGSSSHVWNHQAVRPSGYWTLRTGNHDIFGNCIDSFFFIEVNWLTLGHGWPWLPCSSTCFADKFPSESHKSTRTFPNSRPSSWRWFQPFLQLILDGPMVQAAWDTKLIWWLFLNTCRIMS